MTTADPTPRRLPFHQLVGLLREILVKSGVSQANAEILATNCATCERDGSHSHGLFRIPGYVSTLASGWVDGRAVPRVEDAGPSYVRIDANNGFAQPALAAGRALLVEKVRQSGVAVAAIRNSHHFSALWPDLEPFACEGLVGLSFVTGIACVIPLGGRKPVFGTNPLAFATPVEGHEPLAFDFATSVMSNGDVRIAAQAGRRLPPNSGVNRDGVPTDDPAAILNGGALVPFGGHKGASIILMVEILASALTGGQFSSEVDFSAHPGAETPRTGQLILLIDPARGGNAAFSGRVASLLETVRGAGQQRLPGDRRYRVRRDVEAHGVPISEEQLARLQSYLDP